MLPWAAALTGTVAGIIYIHTANLMLKFQLDDVVNAVAIHLTPGVWGAIAVGLFATEAHIRRAYPDKAFSEYDCPFRWRPLNLLINVIAHVVVLASGGSCAMAQAALAVGTP
jgi:ammonia channel protein AmtB